MVNAIVFFMAPPNVGKLAIRKMLEIYTLIKSFFRGVSFSRRLCYHENNNFVISYDYQCYEEYDSRRTRYYHVFVLRGCYAPPLIGGALPTRSITSVRHR